MPGAGLYSGAENKISQESLRWGKFVRAAAIMTCLAASALVLAFAWEGAGPPCPVIGPRRPFATELERFPGADVLPYAAGNGDPAHELARRVAIARWATVS